MSLGRLLKDIAPVLVGATLGPGIGEQFGASPFISRAVTGALTSKLTGGKTKDALRNALIAGVGGAAFDRFGGAEQAVPQGGEGTIVRSGSTQPTPSNPDIAKKMGVSSVPTE